MPFSNGVSWPLVQSVLIRPSIRSRFSSVKFREVDVQAEHAPRPSGPRLHGAVQRGHRSFRPPSHLTVLECSSATPVICIAKVIIAIASERVRKRSVDGRARISEFMRQRCLDLLEDPGVRLVQVARS